MRNLLPHKERYLRNFAQVVYDDFRKRRYGLTSCSVDLDKDLAYMRQDLLSWQSIDDAGILTEVAMRVWAPLNFKKQPITPTESNNYFYSSTAIAPNSSSSYAQFITEDGQTVVEVNAGGCITRINLNPVVNMGGTVSDNYVHVQALQATTWAVIHNLGYRPVVTIKDTDGVTIEGVVNYINDNQLTITFSQAVAGTAYLS